MNVEAWLKVATPIGAVVAFSWGVFQYIQNERNQAEVRRMEATKPFLELQLQLYTTASTATATLATSDDQTERAAALKRFLALYWGELALVEDRRVEQAMVAFGKGLKRNADREELQRLSLDLAHAFRDSLAASWGVRQWKTQAQ